MPGDTDRTAVQAAGADGESPARSGDDEHPSEPPHIPDAAMGDLFGFGTDDPELNDVVYVDGDPIDPADLGVGGETGADRDVTAATDSDGITDTAGGGATSAPDESTDESDDGTQAVPADDEHAVASGESAAGERPGRADGHDSRRRGPPARRGGPGPGHRGVSRRSARLLPGRQRQLHEDRAVVVPLGQAGLGVRSRALEAE